MREDNSKHKASASGGMLPVKENTTPGKISACLPTGKNSMPNIVHAKPNFCRQHKHVACRLNFEKEQSLESHRIFLPHLGRRICFQQFKAFRPSIKNRNWVRGDTLYFLKIHHHFMDDRTMKG